MHKRFAIIFAAIAACSNPIEKEKSMAMHNPSELENAMPGMPAKTENGWSAFGKLTFTDKDKTVGLQQVFAKTSTYTIRFIKVLPESFDPLGNTNNPIRTSALVEWSVAGNKIRRRISVTNGTSISGVAEAVRVVVSDGSVSLRPAFDYDIGILVAEGPRSTLPYPPILHGGFTLNLNPGATLVVPVPTDAGVSSINVESVQGDAVVGTIEVTQSCGNGGPGMQLKQYIAQPGQFSPVDEAVTAIQLRNAGAAAVSVSFTWGIDG